MNNKTYFSDFKNFFNSKSLLIQLILVNVLVFAGIFFYDLILWFLNQVENSQAYINPLTEFLAVPSNPEQLLFRPWSIFTYMWTHQSFTHILFNMLLLFMGGALFKQYFSEKKLLRVYVLGGLGGALLYVLFYNIFPRFVGVKEVAVLYGASASVLAIFIAAASYAPKTPIRLLLLPPIQLKYVALIFVVIDLVSIRYNNTGGHISHLGGMLTGWLWTIQYKKGKDIASFLSIFDFRKYSSLFKRKKKTPFKNVYYNSRPLNDEEYNANRVANQKKIDEILDKVSKRGYESLSKGEKEILFKASNKE